MQRAKSHIRNLVSKPHDEGSEHSSWSPRFRSRVNMLGFILFIYVTAVLLIVPHREFTPFHYFHVQFEYIYSGLLMVLMFGWIYGINVKLWKSNNIPWTYTMQISSGHAASTAHVWSMCTVLTTLLSIWVTMTMVSLDFEWSRPLFPSSLFPFFALLCFAAFLFLPIHMLYQHTRTFLLKKLAETVVSPFFQVLFLHNFIADILTSLPLAMYRLEYAVCFVVTGDWLYDREVAPLSSNCGNGSIHEKYMMPILYALPFFIRFCQCLSRRNEEINLGKSGFDVSQHSLNAGKYASALAVVVTASIASSLGSNDLNNPDAFTFLWLGALVLKALYCYTWDITMDWGLGAKKHGFLREDRLFSKPLYYFAMFTNFLARCAFALTISPHQCPENWKLTLACVEILRRGQWNVLRLEKEYLVLSPAEKEVAFDFAQPLNLDIPPYRGQYNSDSNYATIYNAFSQSNANVPSTATPNIRIKSKGKGKRERHDSEIPRLKSPEDGIEGEGEGGGEGGNGPIGYLSSRAPRRFSHDHTDSYDSSYFGSSGVAIQNQQSAIVEESVESVVDDLPLISGSNAGASEAANANATAKSKSRPKSKVMAKVKGPGVVGRSYTHHHHHKNKINK